MRMMRRSDFDALDTVLCGECDRRVTLKFVLALHGSPRFVSVGKCKTCCENGDERSILAFAKVSQKTWYEGVMRGMTVIELSQG